MGSTHVLDLDYCVIGLQILNLLAISLASVRVCSVRHVLEEQFDLCEWQSVTAIVIPCKIVGH